MLHHPGFVQGFVGNEGILAINLQALPDLKSFHLSAENDLKVPAWVTGRRIIEVGQTWSLLLLNLMCYNFYT